MLLVVFQTVGVEYNVKVVNIPDTDVQVELYMYDCAGQPIFNTQNSKGEFPNQKHVCYFSAFWVVNMCVYLYTCLVVFCFVLFCFVLFCFVLIEIKFVP